ncbi:MAG: hypothetical protein ACTHOB_15180 [Ginsengibacter sp.]
MFKDVYFYRARLFPALITSIPMLVYFNKIIAVKYYDALKNVVDILPLITHLGLSAAVIFLCVQINRLLAKEIFQRLYFKEETYMPTTNFLLWKDRFYDDSIKTKVREKIKDKYGITLLQPTDEQQNEDRARSLVTTAVSQIRIALKGNKMLFQHNIEYGFWRNLIGGCVLAILFSAITFFYGKSNAADDLTMLGIILFIVYLLPILFSKPIIKSYGRYYAKILYEQFLSL